LAEIPKSKWQDIDQTKIPPEKIGEIPCQVLNLEAIASAGKLMYLTMAQISENLDGFDKDNVNLRDADPEKVRDALAAKLNIDVDISGAAKAYLKNGLLAGSFPGYNPQVYPKNKFKQVISDGTVRIIPLPEDNGKGILISGAESFSMREDGSLEIKMGDKETVLTGLQKGIVVLADGREISYENSGELKVQSNGDLTGKDTRAKIKDSGIVIQGDFRTDGEAVLLNPFAGGESSYLAADVSISTTGYSLEVLPIGIPEPDSFGGTDNSICTYAANSIVCKGAFSFSYSDFQVMSKSESSIFSFNDGKTYAYGQITYEDSGISYKGLTDFSELIRYFEDEDEWVFIDSDEEGFEGDIAEFTRKVKIADITSPDGFVLDEEGELRQ